MIENSPKNHLRVVIQFLAGKGRQPIEAEFFYYHGVLLSDFKEPGVDINIALIGKMSYNVHLTAPTYLRAIFVCLAHWKKLYYSNAEVEFAVTVSERLYGEQSSYVPKFVLKYFTLLSNNRPQFWTQVMYL